MYGTGECSADILLEASLLLVAPDGDDALHVLVTCSNVYKL